MRSESVSRMQRNPNGLTTCNTPARSLRRSMKVLYISVIVTEGLSNSVTRSGATPYSSVLQIAPFLLHHTEACIPDREFNFSKAGYEIGTVSVLSAGECPVLKA